MKKFIRSPAFLAGIFLCIFAVSAVWLCMNSADDPGAAVQNNLTLIRLNSLVEKDGSRPEILSHRDENKESRPSYGLSLPVELSAEVEIKDGGFLDFGLTLGGGDGNPEKRAISCVVYADHGRGRRALFEEKEHLDTGMDRWMDRRVDLSALPAGRAVLTFSIREVSAHTGILRQPIRAYLSCPLLFGSRQAECQGNIIFYLVDTMRADHLSCYGYPREVSPHFNALADDGVLFLSLYSQSSWTAPSTATFFTSLYPSDHGLVSNSDRLSDNMEMLAEVLNRSGYRTKAFVANGFVSASYNFHQGFDSYVECSGTELEGHARGGGIVHRATDWLERNRNQKIFLYLHTVDPHSPYDPPEPFRSKFDRGIRSRISGDHGENSYRQVKNPAGNDIRHIIDLYDGEIAYSDACFGYLVRKLKALGLYDGTMIIVISDHGEEFWEHGGWGHGKKLFIEQLHIPLIMKFPQSRGAGTVVKSRVQALDVMPTILGAVGTAGSAEWEGDDLYSALFGEGAIKERKIFSETKKGDNRLFSLIDGRYEYILRKEPVFQEDLYDLRQDPLERENVIGAHEQIRKGLRREVEGFLSEKGRGYHLLFPDGDASDRIRIVIRGVRRFRNIDILGYTAGQQEGGEVFHEENGAQILLQDLSFKREVVFFPEEDETIWINIEKNGARLNPGAIRMGEKGLRPPSVPFCTDTFKREGRMDVKEKPPAEERGTVICYIWATGPEHDQARPTEDNIRNLRALGYLE